MKILVLDNYDSFTYNLVDYIADIVKADPDVYRHDEITVKEIAARQYDAIVLSPGPGVPKDAGILLDTIQFFAGKIPLFGVCLGLQAITEAFGGSIQNLDRVFHGLATTMTITQKEAIIFQNIPTQFEAARYHSWVANKEDFPKSLEITCLDEDGNIMGLRHKTHLIEAVQFHPESILTPYGKDILRNFLNAV